MADADLAAGLRHGLVDGIARWYPFDASEVEEAMRSVPRHLFLPGVPLETAYGRGAVVTYRDAAGVATSSASAPAVVAVMLEQARVRPGHRVLEIGAGTGYNAALLARLVGSSGQVTTVEIDPGVAAEARRNLDGAGYGQVRVVCGDGAEGDSAGAPFDRIIVTAGVWDIPPAWSQQMAPGGRLVVPLRMRGLTRVVALEHRDGSWHSVSVENDGFMPLRGVGHQPEDNLRLDDKGALILRVDDGQSVDTAGLRQALHGDPVVVWSGVRATAKEGGDGFASLDYWLAGLGSLCRLLVRSREHSIVVPALNYGSMALVEGDTLAYLVKRPEEPADEYELGVCAYGSLAHALAGRVAGVIRAWGPQRQTPVQIAVYPAEASTPYSTEDILLRATKRYVQVVVRTLQEKS